MANKEFIKGIAYGAVFTIAAALLVNSGSILYRTYVKKELNYETKAKAIYKLMEDNYVDEIDKGELYDGIYTGMVYFTTDEYSTYYSADDYKSIQIKNTGEYAGIGCLMSVSSDLKMKIKAVYENSPAEKAGLKAGDIILRVEGTEVTLDNYYDCVDMVRGKKDTPVKLTVLRTDGTSEEVSVMRGDVEVPTVAYKMLDNSIGYIHISAFEEVTAEQYEAAYKALEKDGAKGLIIDLRNNGGGLVTAVSMIADDIIPKGVITYTEDKNGKKNYIYSDEGELNMPLAVLVNGSSASASELLSACIQDTGKGKIIGETTYGKGVVQTTFPLTDGSAVKLTTAKYYTPKGVCIDGIGVKPDVEIAAAADFEVPDVVNSRAETDEENDVQLQRAIEELK